MVMSPLSMASTLEQSNNDHYRLRRLPDVAVEWTQTRNSVTLNIRVPPWARKKHVHVKFSSSAIDVCISGETEDKEPFLKLQRPLGGTVDADGCMWALEDDAHASTLILELEKENLSFWSKLFATDDPDLYTIVDPHAVTNNNNDTTTTTTATTAEQQHKSTIVNGNKQNDDISNNSIVSKMIDDCINQGIENNNQNLQLEHVVGSVVDEMTSKAAKCSSQPIISASANTQENTSTLKPSANSPTSTNSKDANADKSVGENDVKSNGRMSAQTPTTVVEDADPEEVQALTVQRENDKTPGDTQAADDEIEAVPPSSSRRTTTRTVSAAAAATMAAMAAAGRVSGSRNSTGTGPNSNNPNMRRFLTTEDIQSLIAQHEETIKLGPGPLNGTYGEAAIQLATFYHYGIGVKKDDVKAVQLYQSALEDGGVKDATAAFQLGLLYNHGSPPRLQADPTQAVKWWSVAAQLGSPVAMFNLGVMAINGSGCDMDPHAAMAWFAKAKQLDSSLQPPQITPQQLEQRFILAEKLKKEKRKKSLTPQEKQQRQEEALQLVRQLGYTTAGLIAMGISVVAIRYWWRNRL